MILGDSMKEEFKAFVRRNPDFIDYVRNNKITWQQLYEIYDLYGEDNSIWNSFKNNSTNNNSNLFNNLKDFINLFKGIDLNNVQKALSSLDKAIEAFKGFNRNENVNINNYDERPKYKYFED